MSFWDDERRVRMLVDLWHEGLSASQIARRIGGCTRNAVISKTFRLGLSGANQNKTELQKRRSYRSPPQRLYSGMRKAIAESCNAGKAKAGQAAPKMRVEPFVADETQDKAIPLHQRKSLIDLEAEHCRWPVGDPQSPEFFFCGGARVIGSSYCEGHLHRAFQPPAVRRAPEKQKTPEKVPTFEDA